MTECMSECTLFGMANPDVPGLGHASRTLYVPCMLAMINALLRPASRRLDAEQLPHLREVEYLADLRGNSRNREASARLHEHTAQLDEHCQT